MANRDKKKGLAKRGKEEFHSANEWHKFDAKTKQNKNSPKVNPGIKTRYGDDGSLINRNKAVKRRSWWVEKTEYSFGNTEFERLLECPLSTRQQHKKLQG